MLLFDVGVNVSLGRCLRFNTAQRTEQPFPTVLCCHEPLCEHSTAQIRYALCGMGFQHRATNHGWQQVRVHDQFENIT
jgi:hypothetical protein